MANLGSPQVQAPTLLAKSRREELLVSWEVYREELLVSYGIQDRQGCNGWL